MDKEKIKKFIKKNYIRILEAVVIIWATKGIFDKFYRCENDCLNYIGKLCVNSENKCSYHIAPVIVYLGIACLWLYFLRMLHKDNR